VISIGAPADALVFGTVSDPLLAAALRTACGALFATFALLIVIAVMRVRLLRRLERERRLAALWNPLLAQWAAGVRDSLPRLRPRDAESFLLLWCRAQESLRGEAQVHLREMARRLGVEAWTGRLLRSRRIDRRLLALVTLGHLRMRDHAAWLHTLVSSAPPVVSVTAARALMRIDANICVPPLLAATARRDDWPLAAVGSILRECDPQLVGPMLVAAIRSALAKDDAEGVARLLRLHGAAHAETLRDAVLEVIATAVAPEPLAAALAALWHPQDLGHARRLLAHPAWFVRVAAARAIGRFAGQDDVARLAAALADPSWWVRYRAAQALCSIPGMGSAELGALTARLTDRFAADMLRHVIAERTPA
jgi:HEAT repeat protein